MLALIAALAVTVAVPAPSSMGATVVGAKKKKKKTTPPANEPPAETSEGIDLTQPETPPPVSEPPPSDLPATPPAPPPPPPSSWSIVTPHTAGAGGNLLEAGVGWPGLHVAYWRGILEALDVGALVEINWGLQGVVTSPQVGFTIQAQAKYRFFQKDKLSVGATFKPGLLVYFPPARPANVGLVLPLAANAGYALTDKLNLGAFVELPFFVQFRYGVVLPIALGVGAEYFFSEKLGVWVAVKAGPAVWPGTGLFPFLDAKAGVGFHL